MKKSSTFVTILILVMGFSSAWAGSPEEGKKLVNACVICHGESGNSLAGAYPKLAGQSEKYLLKQMKDMLSGARPAPLMAGQLDAFSVSDLEHIAAYYAGQKGTIGAAEADKVALGETIYRSGIARKQIAACTACHLPNGAGIDMAAFPALGGQWPEYSVGQLKAFRNGSRTNDGDGKMMQGVARDLSDEEIEAVSSYLYGLSN